MNKTIKGVAKSKTMYLAVALSVLGTMLENFPELKVFLGENYDLAFVVLSMVVAKLRFLTTKPLNEK